MRRNRADRLLRPPLRRARISRQPVQRIRRLSCACVSVSGWLPVGLLRRRPETPRCFCECAVTLWVKGWTAVAKCGEPPLGVSTPDACMLAKPCLRIGMFPLLPSRRGAGTESSLPVPVRPVGALRILDPHRALGRGMPALEKVAEIRDDHFRDKVPTKAIGRKRQVSRNTGRKVVRKVPNAAPSSGRKYPSGGRRNRSTRAHGRPSARRAP